MIRIKKQEAAAAAVSSMAGSRKEAKQYSAKGHELPLLRQQHEETVKLPKTEAPAEAGDTMRTAQQSNSSSVIAAGRENKARNTSLRGHELPQLRQQHQETTKLPKTEAPEEAGGTMRTGRKSNSSSVIVAGQRIESERA
jgi:hypothetical protein